MAHSLYKEHVARG